MNMTEQLPDTLVFTLITEIGIVAEQNPRIKTSEICHKR